MRMYPHFKGENSFLSVQLSSVRAKLFRNGALKGPLVIPSCLVQGMYRGRGWYRFLGTELEIRRIANYIQNRIDAVEFEENQEIQSLLAKELGECIVSTAVEYAHTRVSPLVRKPKPATLGALLALQRRFNRHHSV